jgi:hypothetical protein
MGKLDKRFRLYSKFIGLYPAPYRRRYGGEMLQTLADMLDDPDNSKAAVWLRAVLDLPLSLTKQNLISVGGIMKNQTPHYVKRNSLISAALVIPFFVVIASRILQNNSIVGNQVWRSSLWITVLFMPIAAFLLAAYTFLKWTKNRKISVWKGLIDFRHNWMLTTVGSLALLIAVFVPFHDSTHCVSGNPVREIRNADQTWQCVWRG